mmetsp:Transcript_3893/g.9238  ORF Transcript_3893/g.9238 Transcript_3893/m.9238 type:complete len:228 (+) Transcript_3893:628-1311(+)
MAKRVKKPCEELKTRVLSPLALAAWMSPRATSVFPDAHGSARHTLACEGSPSSESIPTGAEAAASSMSPPPDSSPRSGGRPGVPAKPGGAWPAIEAGLLAGLGATGLGSRSSRPGEAMPSGEAAAESAVPPPAAATRRGWNSTGPSTSASRGEGRGEGRGELGGGEGDLEDGVEFRLLATVARLLARPRLDPARLERREARPAAALAALSKWYLATKGCIQRDLRRM